MRRVLLGLGMLTALAFTGSSAEAQTGYYRNDYFGSGYTGVFDFMGSVDFVDPGTQGPYPYYGYGRPLYYTGYGGYYPAPGSQRISAGYAPGAVPPYCGGMLPPSIMTP
jgi:hypothetical protein